MDGKWAVLFSHPKDFTPVCTTELGYLAKIEHEFDKRGVKIIELSVDAVADHARWAADIKETEGCAPQFPMIGDPDLTIAKMWGMLPAAASGDASKRTAADNQTVRNVFVIGPDKKIKLIMVYPMTTGRNFDEVLRVIELAAAHGEAQGCDPCELEAGRRRDHRDARSPTRTPGRRFRRAGRRPSRTCGSWLSRTDAADRRRLPPRGSEPPSPDGALRAPRDDASQGGTP